VTREETLEWLWERFLSNAEDHSYLKIDGMGSEFLSRIPNPDGIFADEEPERIHICRPIELKEAVENRDRERTVAHSGYVRNGVCMRCNTAWGASTVFSFDDSIKELRAKLREYQS
jgi:hypothetical protein